MPAKTIQAPNFARSAIAPLISATVMIANTAWNADEGQRRDAGGLAGDAAERGGGHQALQADEVEVADEAAAGVVAERERVAVQHPQHADEPEGAEAHHHHVEDALGADHAAVEEREAWSHEQHERGAREYPGGVAGAGCHGGSSLGTGVCPAGWSPRVTDRGAARFRGVSIGPVALRPGYVAPGAVRITRRAGLDGATRCGRDAGSGRADAPRRRSALPPPAPGAVLGRHPCG